MGLNTIQLFEADSNTPKEVRLEYSEMIDNESFSNGHSMWFFIEEDTAYPKLTEYLLSLGVTDKCLIRISW